MSLVEKILPYERDLFLWLNDHHTQYWDNFMYLYSGKHVWLPLAIAAFFVFVYKTKWKDSSAVFSLMAYNLFNKNYWMASRGDQVYVSTPRTYMLSVQYEL